MKKIVKILSLLTIAIILIVLMYFKFFSNNKKIDSVISTEIKKETTKKTPGIQKLPLALPLDNALARITKKPFGIKVSPNNSPVSSERFSGFHTGTDFETTTEEANVPVEVKVIIDGTIINKLSVSGYGGVILEKAEINNQSVIILYGHVDIRPQNSHINVGDSVKKGDVIAILSPANSPESGYERKHLHLGIIKGEKIDYRGYVPTKKELSNWIDPASVL